MESYGVDTQLFGLLQDINENAKAVIRLDKEMGMVPYKQRYKTGKYYIATYLHH